MTASANGFHFSHLGGTDHANFWRNIMIIFCIFHNITELAYYMLSNHVRNQIFLFPLQTAPLGSKCEVKSSVSQRRGRRDVKK